MAGPERTVVVGRTAAVSDCATLATEDRVGETQVMNGEFIEALQQIAKEKDIPLETLIETVESALATAYQKNFPANTRIIVRIDANKSASSPFRVFCEKTIVEEVTNDALEISLS